MTCVSLEFRNHVRVNKGSSDCNHVCSVDIKLWSDSSLQVVLTWIFCGKSLVLEAIGRFLTGQLQGRKLWYSLTLSEKFSRFFAVCAKNNLKRFSSVSAVAFSTECFISLVYMLPIVTDEVRHVLICYCVKLADIKKWGHYSVLFQIFCSPDLYLEYVPLNLQLEYEVNRTDIPDLSTVFLLSSNQVRIASCFGYFLKH